MFVRKIKKLSKLVQIQINCRVSSNSSSKIQNADVFAIKDVTNHDVKGTLAREDLDKENLDKKYAYLNNLNRLDNEETILHYPHGHIRLDKDNKPKYHGQYDEDNRKIRFDIQSLEKLNKDENDKINDNNKEELNKELTKESLENSDEELVKKESVFISQIKNLTNKIKKEEKIKRQEQLNKEARPYRIKVDTSKVDFYDFKPIKKDFENQKLVFNTNLNYSSTNFKFANQWSEWIEKDIECQNSPLAIKCRQYRLLLNPFSRDKYENLNAGELKGIQSSETAAQYGQSKFLKEYNVTIEEEIEKDPNLYTPLKSLKEINQELDEYVGSTTDELNQEKEESKELNIKKIFDKGDSIIKKNLKADHQTDDEEEPAQEELILSQITALDYLRKIKNKEVKTESKFLNKLVDEKNKKSKKVDNTTFKSPKLEYDSKGFKNYKNQVLNLYNLTCVDRALYLESEIIFNNLGIVVVNKPYGLCCPGDQDTLADNNNRKLVKLTSFIKDFAYLVAIQDKKDSKENTFEDLANPVLYPIYKLDRNCTGVYILAKNKETAKKVHELFKNQNASLFYDAITKNVPKQEKAVIDIPIEKDRRDKYGRMFLRPELPKEFKEYRAIVKPSKTADKAVTNYKILKVNKSAAYVELSPMTFVKHQLRVHLGFGLRTPILGDHLYDNVEKVDYQKLPLDMLLGLNVRPTKLMHMPMHLHCKLIILNGFGTNAKDVFLRADLPDFFRQNLKSLKLN